MVVVGGGTAGAVAAGRLAAAGARVVLVEAGPGRSDDPALSSLDATRALARPERFDDSIEAVTAAGRRLAYRSGRGLGGGSAINAMVVTAGDRADYDRWAAHRGCPGWDGAAMELWLAAAAATVGITEVEPGPVASALAAAAGAAGHRPGGPSAPLDATGVLTASLTARHGRRRSAADAYLDLPAPAPGPATAAAAAGSLHLATGATVARVTHERARVTGVVLADGSALPADRVVVCGGALRTPALLAASGIGPPGPWPVTDHPSFVLTVARRPASDQDSGQDFDGPPRPAISGLVRWSSGIGPGPGGGGGAELPADLMALGMDHVGPGPEGHRYGALIVLLTDVAAVGRVELATGGGLTVDPGWLGHPLDRARFRAGVRHLVALAADGAFDPVATGVFADDAGTPASHLADLDDDALDRWLADHPGPVRHPASSLPLGAAVDLAGAVAGVAGLTVADASVLPRVPNANPMLVVLAVAERLAAGLAAGTGNL
ncbi:MAG: GMC family oxidoreductase N-terminal domain-containing protein [Acidimicrobiales bacterium]